MWRNGQFIISTDMSVSKQWTHIVLNYFGPNDGQGIQVYFNGVEVGQDTSKASKSFSTGDGRVVLGRRKTDSDKSYASADVDEVLFFNTKLNNTQAMMVSNLT